MSQRSRHRIRPVLAQNRRRIGNLTAVAPPEANRELLRLALQVITHEQLGAVTDVIVNPRCPLEVVLVEDLRLDVVVPASVVRIGVGGRVQLHQSAMFGSRSTSGFAFRILRQSGRIQTRCVGCRPWVAINAHLHARTRVVVVVGVPYLLKRSGREVTPEHGRGGDRRAEQARIQDLVEVLESREEEQLVAVLIEVRCLE